MKYYYLILSLVFYSCSSLIKFETPSNINLTNQLAIVDSAKLIYEVNKLPEFALAFLRKEKLVMTDANKFYVNTDVRFDNVTPNSKIVFCGWASKELYFIVYESQRITTQSQLIVFKILNKKYINVEEKFIACRPLTFLDLKICIN